MPSFCLTERKRFDPFAELMKTRAKQVAAQHKLWGNPYKILDPGKKGMISATQLKAFATKLGEPLSEEEFALLLREAQSCGSPSGFITYQPLITLLQTPC
eukprot:TRINITY_DN1514_c0_g1_i20.p1 TRINITY_DN1514_c0_g1~~TRINITY_DN1514_c0_g1_i20.p1  ORF type:complete len:100 (+),score=5.61 TRINITY_DN1514_c0_g1_i20:61-360(+)